MTKFFHRLTINNWGLPWHALIAFGVTSKAIKWGVCPQLVVPGVVILGLLYGIWQYKRAKKATIEQKNKATKDFWQDWVAEFAGILVGVL